MRALALSLLLALAVAPAAAAKGVVDAVVCGPDRCAPALDHLTYAAFDGGPSTSVAPARVGPWYELRFKRMGGVGEHVDREIAMTRRFAPEPGMVRDVDGTWEVLDPSVVRALKAKAAGIRPYVATRRGSDPVHADPARTGGFSRTGSDPVQAGAVVVGGLALVGGAVLLTRRRRAAARS